MSSFVKGSDRVGGNQLVKRLLDIAISGGGLLFLSPIMAIIGSAILVKMGRPVLFTQMRPGLNDVPFRLYKFRSMDNGTDGAGQPLPDGERITPLGQFLRRTSLDELPELWNVLKGDMSMVGPRPLLMEYLDLYSSSEGRRHRVRPGLTGLAQVQGRNSLTWEEKLSLDLEYVDSASLRMDLMILLQTVPAVIGRQGINQEGHATASIFRGTKDERV